MKVKKRIWIPLIIVLDVIVGFLLPEPKTIPVKDATSNDWHQNTFWYEPWGRSGVHKGIDIFAPKGKEARSTTYGWVIYQGELSIGGNVVVALGPKWRIHYYAHLDTIDVNAAQLLNVGEKIGTVGDSGNARGKQPHVHYSIISLIPYPWRVDNSTQGWKKMFFLDPGLYLTEN